MKNLAVEYESSLRMRDGISIYYSVRIPKDVKAVIVLTHGVCEHCGRYDYLSEKLNKAGYGFVRYDLRGHGKSGGDRGHLKSFRDLPDDLDELMTKICEEFKDFPIYQIGHSLGAMVSVLYALSYPQSCIKGQILSGLPAIELPLSDINLLKKLPYNKFPKINAANTLGKFVSRDPAVVTDYIGDPLNLKKSTIGLSSEVFLKAPPFIEDHVWEYTFPCLILHGGDDRIVTPRSSEWFFESIMSEDKTRKIYPGLYHEIYNEPERDEVIKDTINWLDARFSKALER